MNAIHKDKGLPLLRSPYLIFSFFLLLFIPTSLMAEPEVLILNKTVGYTIDPIENLRFRIFSDTTHFISAQFIDENGIKIQKRTMSPFGIITSSERIGYLGFSLYQTGFSTADSTNKINPINSAISPKLHFLETLSCIQKNQVCKINIKRKFPVTGMFHNSTFDELQIWYNREICKIPVNRVHSITVYPGFQDYRFAKPTSMFIVSLTGWIISRQTATFLNFRPNDRKMAESVGIASGLVLGFYLGDYFNTIMNSGIKIILKSGHKRPTLSSKIASSFSPLKQKQAVGSDL